MDLNEPRRKPPAENIVPMINVVFLLLIFFLMTATIAPLEPFDVSPPESSRDAPTEINQPLFVSADGSMVWSEVEGEAVFAAIAAYGLAATPESMLVIKADRSLPGTRIAGLLKQLATYGIVRSQLVSVRAP